MTNDRRDGGTPSRNRREKNLWLRKHRDSFGIKIQKLQVKGFVFEALSKSSGKTVVHDKAQSRSNHKKSVEYFQW